MRINSIEWKNIFAYGEEKQTLTYEDQNLVLLQGRSGSGKSTILSLPSLLIYGKLDKLKNSKSSIANRINKNGWIKGEITKGQNTYIIERTFSPNSVTVLKNGVDIQNFGSKDAQDYIETEIIDLPMATFNNMIAISMKRFKSFLTMSTPDRKQIIDRVFSLEVINLAFEKIKKDSREIGNAINSDNSTMFQLQQTLSQAISELQKIQANSVSEEFRAEIDKNTANISQCQQKIQQLNDIYNTESQKQVAYNQEIMLLRQKQGSNMSNISLLQEKLNLFSQDKCPTCGTSFNSESFQEIKDKLHEKYAEQEKIKNEINTKQTEITNNLQIVLDNLNKLRDVQQKLKDNVSQLLSRNAVLESQIQNSSEATGIKSIISKTEEQIKTLQNNIAENTIKLNDLQKLALVFSIDGVKQQVINNYLPILNKEIAENLELVNFPYQIEIDSKFEPHLKELSQEVQPETLSDGEETRVDLVILCSLFKLLKRRYPTINILFVDEVISSLGVEDSAPVLDFLKTFAKNNNLCVFIVSHTNLYLDNFDKIISVTKNGFSKITITTPQK